MTVTMIEAHRGVAGGPRRHYVRCRRYGKRRPGKRCGFSGYRHADSLEHALIRVCPRCGEPVETPR